jgi:HAD superfamily phosphoserine phosphatase-like hydrolase
MTRPACDHYARSPRPSPAAARSFDAVVLDIDDTLTLDNSLTELIRKLGGRLEDLAAFADSCRVPAADPAVLKARFLKLLHAHHRRVTRDRIARIFSDIRLRPEAVPLIAGIRASARPVCLISSSFDMYVKIVANRLGIGEYYWNIRLSFGASEALTGVDFTPEAADLKHQQLHHFCRRRGLDPARVLVVGDNNNDLEMFTCTGNGVLMASARNHDLTEHAWRVVTDLNHVARFLLPQHTR